MAKLSDVLDMPVVRNRGNLLDFVRGGLMGVSTTATYSPQTTGTRNFVIFDPDIAKILKRE